LTGLTDRLTNVWLPVAVLVLALVPLGSPFPVARNAVMLVVALAFLGSAARLLFLHGKQGTFQVARSAWDGVNPFVLLAMPMLVAVQAVLQLTIGFSAGSTYAIVQSWMLLTVMAAFYLLTNSALRDHAAIKALVASLVVIVSVEALYGVLNLLSGNEHILGLYPRRL